MGSLGPPQPEFGRFSMYCIDCRNSWEETGFSNKYDKELPRCKKCGKEVPPTFKPFDPDGEVDD